MVLLFFPVVLLFFPMVLFFPVVTPGGHSIRVAAMLPAQEISKARAEA